MHLPLCQQDIFFYRTISFFFCSLRSNIVETFKCLSLHSDQIECEIKFAFKYQLFNSLYPPNRNIYYQLEKDICKGTAQPNKKSTAVIHFWIVMNGFGGQLSHHHRPYHCNFYLVSISIR